MPRVSVIIPNFNHAQYLDERICSVLNQSYQDFEIIILDDCSTDNSREVIEKYRSDPRVSSIVFNESNGGSAFKQWDKGIALAKGELIWIAESDDVATPDLLERLTAEFDRDPDCVLAFCQAMLIDPEGRQTELHRLHTRLGGSWKMKGSSFIRKWLGRANYVVNASGALFKAAAASNLPDYINSSYRQFRGVGDWLFWIGIATQGNISYCASPMNHFRQHQTNTTSTLYKSGQGSLEQALALGIIAEHHLLSPYKVLRLRASNVAEIKYCRPDLEDSVRQACLQAWRAELPLVALWVFYKRTVHSKYRV